MTEAIISSLLIGCIALGPFFGGMCMEAIIAHFNRRNHTNV